MEDDNFFIVKGRKYRKILVGDIFSKLTVIEILPSEKGKNHKFKCICVCGNECESDRNGLLIENKDNL